MYVCLLFNVNAYFLMYVCISPRCSKGEKTESFTDPACEISNPRTSDRFTNPCQVTTRRNVFEYIHSFIHTYIQTVLLLTLYCIMFCTILSIAEFFSWAFFFALAFAFVTELLACSACVLSTFVLFSGFCIQEVFFSSAGKVQQGCL